MEPTEHTALDFPQDEGEIQRLLIPVRWEDANNLDAVLRQAPQADSTAATDGRHHQANLHFNRGANLTFPSNTTLIEPAANFPVFAGEHSNNNDNNNDNNSLETRGPATSDARGSLGKLKNAPAESNSSRPLGTKTENQNQRKRKVRGKKGKAPMNSSKSGTNASGGDAVPSSVHVRARPGQATDSHSLAERARRGKINGKMKKLQEMVPGCNKDKISTTSALEEIIKHVQWLQHQVKFLSMSFEAVNAMTDLNLDSELAAEGNQVRTQIY